MSNTNYPRIAEQLAALLDPQLPFYSNLANFSALLWLELEDINWAGSYLYSEKQQCLVLGPFQGKPACTVIPVGRGVCGTAYQQKQTLVVEDVHAFAGHIACDAASESEIVLPLYADGKLIGVVDIDSPIKDRFNTADKQGLEMLVAELEKSLSGHF